MIKGTGPRAGSGKEGAPRGQWTGACSPRPPPGWAEGVLGKGLWTGGLRLPSALPPSRGRVTGEAAPAPTQLYRSWSLIPASSECERGRALGGPHPGGCTELEPQSSLLSKPSSDPSSGGCLTPLAPHDRQHRPQNSQALRVWLLSLCPLEGGLAPL